MAAAVALQAAAPPPARTTPVMVAAHDLAAGRQVRDGDLRVTGWRPGTEPSDATADPAALVGRTLSGPVRRGGVVGPAELLGPGLLTGQAPDLLAVPVRLADAAGAGLARRGDRVDVIAAASASTVVSSAVVLADPPAAAGEDAGGVALGAGGSGSGAGSSYGGSVVILGVRLAEAEQLARAQSAGALSLALHAS